MRQFKNLTLLAFVGLPGSGVSTAVDYLKSKQYPSVYFGGVILQAMKQAGIDDTPENEQSVREKFRRDHGADAVVQKIIPEINNLAHSGQHRIVLDGLYSWTEYKILKHEYPGQIIIVSLVAPRHIRHRRLAHRHERALTEAQADQRDWSEIEQLEKGGPIAVADYFITNDASPEQLQAKIDQLLHHIKF